MYDYRILLILWCLVSRFESNNLRARAHKLHSNRIMVKVGLEFHVRNFYLYYNPPEIRTNH